LLDNLSFSIERHGLRHPVDELDGRQFPKGYENASFTFSFNDNAIPGAYANLPWEVLRSGIRAKDPPTAPKILNSLSEAGDIFPAHVEIGCGPSVGCGVPPLCDLHGIFKVTNHGDGRFILGTGMGDTLIGELLSSPYSFLGKACGFFVRLVEARPNAFFQSLKRMVSKGLVIEPIFTNNFDRLLAASGLQSHFLRRYDESNIIPDIQFDNGAKSLIVVGVHADRRKLWAAARKNGMTVLHIDPETYSVCGKKVAYPIEGGCSLLIRDTASSAFSSFIKGTQ
jgi:hypothetical protein